MGPGLGHPDGRDETFPSDADESLWAGVRCVGDFVAGQEWVDGGGLEDLGGIEGYETEPFVEFGDVVVE